jgi:hypothetical protein
MAPTAAGLKAIALSASLVCRRQCILLHLRDPLRDAVEIPFQHRLGEIRIAAVQIFDPGLRPMRGRSSGFIDQYHSLERADIPGRGPASHTSRLSPCIVGYSVRPSTVRHES